MPVIHTQFMGPTNHRGSRVQAFADSAAAGRRVRVTLPWAYDLGVAANHSAAAEALAKAQGWAGDWKSVDATAGGYLFVRTLETRDAFTVDEA